MSHSLGERLNEHDARRLALGAVASSTRASIRAALGASLSSPASDATAELFRSAREWARRERVAPADLIAIIETAWAEVASAAGMPAAERGDRLATILTHAIAWVIEGESRSN